MGKRIAVLEQFVAHDKYVFVAPVWEFTFPAVLKKYLDTISVPQVTFNFNEHGLADGVLKGRKAIFIQSSGSSHFHLSGMQELDDLLKNENLSNTLKTLVESIENHGLAILKSVLASMGIIDLKSIIAHSQMIPNVKDKVLEDAIIEAINLANEW